MTQSPSSLPRVSSLSASADFERELAEAKEALRKMQAEHDTLAIDYAGVQRDLTKQRREITLLRRELAEERENDPKSKQIREVLDYWIDRLGKRSNTKVPAGGERWNKVRARLNDGFSVEALKQAVDGCKAMPYVGPHGRQAADGPGANRHDGIELICRDETTVERFIGYARTVEAAQSSPVADGVGRSEGTGRASRRGAEPTLTVAAASPRLPEYGRRPIDRVLDALPNGFREGTTQHCWVARCPAHEDRDPSLSIRVEEGMDGEIVLLNCFAGCKTDDVVEALGLGMADLFATRIELDSHRPARKRSGEVPLHLRRAMKQLLGEDAA